MENIYLKQLYDVFPRVLSMFDRDPYSNTCGVGNRFYWGWKLIDFGNGTFQGAANCFSRLLKHDLLPNMVSKESMEKRIRDMFLGANYLRRRNGSMEEAFPYESSFCVTALVAYDLLTSMELQQNDLSREEWEQRLGIILPMVSFLCKADETHAFISNHLATAVAALYKWFHFTGDLQAYRRGTLFLERIIAQRSKEGWFREYEGADPGYQTLCMHYLTDVYKMMPNDELENILRKAIQFLCYFAHPDGSFGGIYGSRNTRFFYPTAFEYFKDSVPEARSLADFMYNSIGTMSTVTLASMDEPNIVPMLNSYAWAAVLRNTNREKETVKLPQIPALCKKEIRQDFSEAGIYIRGTNRHYTIISIRKGGVTASYSRDTSQSNIDVGNVIEFRGELYSTQVNYDTQSFSEKENAMIVEVSPSLVLHSLPQPWQFALLRVLNCTLMRNRFFNEFIKKVLVKMLITRKKKLKHTIIRIINFEGDLAVVTAKWASPVDKMLPKIEKASKNFRSIHMASAGYWQRGDDK